MSTLCMSDFVPLAHFPPSDDTHVALMGVDMTSSAESPIISHIKVCSFLFESVGGYEALVSLYTEAVDEETCPTDSRFTVR